MDGRRIAGLQRSLLSCLQKYEEIYKYAIDEYSLIECLITKDFQAANVSNDYFYFCLAKACKSSIAINMLLESKLPEDAIVLIRTVYESYLHMSFSVSHYEEIDKLVSFRVGIHNGLYQHPETRKGKKDYRKIIIDNDKPAEDINLSSFELASKTGYVEDKLLHNILYSYLSEHSHPHFMASGSYRAERGMPRYCYDRADDNTLQASFLAAYVNTLVLSSFMFYENVDDGMAAYCKNVIKKGVIILHKSIDTLNFPVKYKNADTYMKNRTKKIIHSLYARRECC